MKAEVREANTPEPLYASRSPFEGAAEGTTKRKARPTRGVWEKGTGLVILLDSLSSPGIFWAMTPIAALFVDPQGVYFSMPGIDCWEKSRDARGYAGSAPVVAHPPCQLWGRFAAVNYKRWGGEHNRPGNDGGCFASALANVRRCGGVLEHPAFSNAWAAHGLERPLANCWTAGCGGWTCEIWQSAYGHKARKRTWLYYVGETAPLPMNWLRIDGSHQIGFHDQRGKERNKPTISGRAASATPRAFADALLGLAAHSRNPAALLR